MAPDPGVNADSFSVRWTRTLYFPSSLYRFTLGHDDGARLWIDGNLLIDQWNTCCRTDTASIALSGAHDLRVEMFDAGGTANVQLVWSDQYSHEAYLPIIWR
ncbi:Anti-sigma-I factor RsgI3 [Anaerolineae bacterium]|nr:Anti-sigma-I factor RsgI3 [Anaerolineae bacterium]